MAIVGLLDTFAAGSLAIAHRCGPRPILELGDILAILSFLSSRAGRFSEGWRCNDLDEISFSIGKIENLREEMKDFRCESVRTNISHRFLFDVVAFRDKKEKRIIIIRGIHFEEIFLTPRRKSSFFITE